MTWADCTQSIGTLYRVKLTHLSFLNAFNWVERGSGLHCSAGAGLEPEREGWQGRPQGEISVTEMGDEHLGAGFSCVASPNLKLV